MKVLITHILALCIFTPCFSQSQGVLNYKLTVKSPFRINEVNMITYFKGNKSMEYFVPKNVPTSTEKVSETEFREVKVIETKFKPFVYKDIENQKLLLSENIFVKPFFIADTLNNFKWKITSEHTKILNYNCTKALLNFRGRNYIAWFAEQIPLPFGPWKFGGLPGLIFKISDTEEKFIYELTGIDFNAKFNLSVLNIPAERKNEKPLSHREFKAIYNKKVEDYAKMSKIVTTYPNGATGRATVILPELQEKF